MLTDATVYTLQAPTVALLAGFATSLHCAAMCSPLLCATLRANPKSESQSSNSSPFNISHLPFLSYAVGKTLSYTILGALAGLLGSPFAQWLGDTPAQIAPWFFILFFLSLLFGFDNTLVRIRVLGSWGRRLSQRAYQVKGPQRGFALGFATPLIPCGPLYIMFWAAAMSANPSTGALILLSFSLGTLPLLLLAASGYTQIAKHLKPARLLIAKKSIAAIAITVLLIRATTHLSPELLANLQDLCTW